MSEERVRCVKCERWMFHLAQKCPHCGALQPTRVDQKLSNVTTDEAKALLEVSNSNRSPTSFFSVAHEMVMPREGALEVVLSFLAAPLTIAAVALTGWYHSPIRRWRAIESELEMARLVAVPGSAVMLAVFLADAPQPAIAYGVLGVSFVSWAVRGVRRMSKP